MNADPPDTRSPHLDLEDLIAGMAGQATESRVRRHLAGCEDCRAEANRWNLVADGVRGLAADMPQTQRRAPGAPGTRTRHAGLRAPAGPRRRPMMAASAAAVLVLAGGAAYWATAASAGHTPGTVLTAVGGCAGVEQASGTLERVSGSTLVIKTASGQPVTVTTKASTTVILAGAPRSDIADGAPVTVGGPRSGGTIAANFVTVANPARTHPHVPPGFAVVRGTVSDASAAGFTVTTSGGTRVPVTTSGGTQVTVVGASVGELRVGAAASAVGYAGPDRALSALAVAQSPPAASAPSPLIGISPHANVRLRVSGRLHAKDCSPASLADALATTLVSGG